MLFNDDFFYAVILRMQENRQKATTQLLVKDLETARLSWLNLAHAERTIITSLNLPTLTPSELKFNYILDSTYLGVSNPKENVTTSLPPSLTLPSPLGTVVHQRLLAAVVLREEPSESTSRR